MVSSKKSKKSASKRGGKEYEEKLEKYMKQLCKYIDEKELNDFWVFADTKFSERLSGEEYLLTDIKKLAATNPKKYANRKIANIIINCTYNKPNSLQYKCGIYLVLIITVYQIDNNGKINREAAKSTAVCWEKDDFKISKVNLKLVEKLMRLAVDKDFYYYAFEGVPLTEFMKKIKYKKIDISKYLTPI